MAARNILVVGATGKQGTAVVDALLALPPTTPPLRILALTRSTESAKAKTVADKSPSVIELVQGDFLQPEALFAARPHGSVAAVFLYTLPGSTPEDKQAVPFIEAAAKHGVKHIVFSSVDRGGEPKSWSSPTAIKHFYEKHAVELFLRDKLPGATAGQDKPTWTILRPVAFMDNLNPGMFGSMFSAMWNSSLGPDKKLQLVSTRDIGVFAAKALTRPEEWANKAVSLAGDDLSLEEARVKFKAAVGKDMPQAWGIFAQGLLWGVAEVGKMFDWFAKEGYGADVAALKKEEPGLQDLEAWLRKDSGWKGETQH